MRGDEHISQETPDTPPERGQPIGGRRVLDSLPMRARTTGKAAAARTRMVRRLRIALPALALVLVAAFVFNTGSNKADDIFLDDFKEFGVATEDLRMANPQFDGIDDRGQPFQITADAAIRSPEDRNVVTLDQPRAVQGAGDEETTVTAATGVYQSEANILELADDVTLEHRFGKETYVLRSPSATVSIQDEVVQSDAGVGGRSTEGGALKADTMRAYRGEGRVVFEGNVSMRIIPNSTMLKPAEAPSEDAAQAETNAPGALKDPEINEF
ncbi:MAG: LPS export ABC transporter periplasmic protein LptC [Pseudomonadota bacterium]